MSSCIPIPNATIISISSWSWQRKQQRRAQTAATLLKNILTKTPMIKYSKFAVNIQ